MAEVKHSDYEEVVEDVAVQLSAQLKNGRIRLRYRYVFE